MPYGKNNYSEKEWLMFKAILGEEPRGSLLSSLSPVEYYQTLVNLAFQAKLTGPAVDSLRRCHKAISKCNPYRETPEWDDLISLEGSENKK